LIIIPEDEVYSACEGGEVGQVQGESGFAVVGAEGGEWEKE